MSDINIGLQIYSLRDLAAAEVLDTLRKVAALGYQGIEFAGYFGATAEQLRDTCAEVGLEIVGTHSWWVKDSMCDENIPATVAWNKTMGNRRLVGGIGSISPAERETVDGWVNLAAQYNHAAALVRPHHMQVGYHNHGMEFEVKVDGKPGYDILADHTVDDVILQFDVGGAASGGADSLKVVKRLGPRMQTVHCKPWSHTQGYDAVIGADDMPWREMIAHLEGLGTTEWYIVEYESRATDPLTAVARCHDALRAFAS